MLEVQSLCSITAQWYASLLKNKISLEFQAGQCSSSTVYGQHISRPHISRCVMDFLKIHFTEDHVINLHFPHTLPLLSGDLNTSDIWLWNNSEYLVSGQDPRTLCDLKNDIPQHVRNILRLNVEYVILRFRMVTQSIDWIEWTMMTIMLKMFCCIKLFLIVLNIHKIYNSIKSIPYRLKFELVFFICSNKFPYHHYKLHKISLFSQH